MYRKKRTLKEIKLFVKRHYIILILCLIGSCSIAKVSQLPVIAWLPEPILSFFLCPKAGTTAFEWWSIINNLCLAFIASMITYIMIQYIPERRKAYKAFFFIKGDLTTLYTTMSRLIKMYLFELGIKMPENKLTLSGLSSLPNIEILDKEKSCKIEKTRNGNPAHEGAYGYNLFRESKKYAELVKKSIDCMKTSIYVGYLDAEITEIIATIENNWFLSFFQHIQAPITRSPGAKSVILDFDKGFYELVSCHLQLRKYKFEQCSYEFEKISDEEMKSARDKLLFMMTRGVFKYIKLEDIMNNVNRIISLEPTEEHIRKSKGVFLEMLVYYDFERPKPVGILKAALEIAKYIMEHETDEQGKSYALLNYYQVKKRMNSLYKKDVGKLKRIIADKKASNDVVLGAAILCGDIDKAVIAFNDLSEDGRNAFIQAPIYHLWNNPPVAPDLDPPLFIQ